VSLASALGEARQRGIHVNSIYCGQSQAREALAWRKLAALGAGEFAAMDHNQSQLAQVTPYDAELGRLSKALNKTYVGYGDGAGLHLANQKAQDDNASANGAQVAAARAGAKASPAYNNEDWDLVDAFAHHRRVEKLPDTVATMSESERAGFLRSRLEERQTLQQRIHDLSGKRDAFLSTPTPSQPTKPAPPMSKPAGGHASMDEALIGTVRKQAQENGYGF